MNSDTTAHTEGPPAYPRPASLELRHVRKRYPGTSRPAIEDLTLTVPAGEVCVLVGPSGCGKTTAMQLVNRMIELTGGEILLDGASVMERRPAELRREIGYAIQRQLLWSVELPLALPATVAGLRIATVTVISLATVAVFVVNEGLGAPIYAGLQQTVKTELIAAGALCVVLALLAELLFAGLQRAVTPRALRLEERGARLLGEPKSERTVRT